MFKLKKIYTPIHDYSWRVTSRAHYQQFGYAGQKEKVDSKEKGPLLSTT
jgi:hypothetical protein